MSTINYEMKYSCDNDCKQSGCPEHTAKLSFQTTANVISFDDGDGTNHHFDLSKLTTLLKLLNQMTHRVEIKRVLREGLGHERSS